jgi:hypothetical protein
VSISFWAKKEIEKLRDTIKTAEEKAFFDKLVESYLFITMPKMKYHSLYYRNGIKEAKHWIHNEKLKEKKTAESPLFQTLKRIMRWR